MPNIFIYAILTLICGATLFYIRQDSGWGSFVINILATAAIFFIQYLTENSRYLWLLLLCNTKYYKKKIRFSISYLYQIKVDGKYLLVKGNRINQLQPVGGVYKRYRESFYILKNLSVSDDDNIPIDEKSFEDLRVKVPGKNVRRFLKWYNSQLGREVSPYREFYEELIRTGLVTQKIFPYTNYLHLKRIQTPIHFSNHFKCYEILIAEIFMLMPDDQQKQELRNLINTPATEYFWVSESSIEKLGSDINRPISPTAKWIL
jgi:hypothetical protein